MNIIYKLVNFSTNDYYTSEQVEKVLNDLVLDEWIIKEIIPTNRGVMNFMVLFYKFYKPKKVLSE